jgi:Cu-Zn family superoxide dismutase
METALRSSRSRRALLCATLAAVSPAAFAFTVSMYQVNNNGSVAHVGTIEVDESPYGVIFTPKLQGLPPGIHGFHVHENPSCEYKMQEGKLVPAAAAGGHYDPAKTGKHQGPWGEGHLGDLPAIYVDAAGNATYPVAAPRLKLADVRGRALMIHAGGDNHADMPMPLGGGGVRIVCGVTSP